MNQQNNPSNYVNRQDIPIVRRTMNQPLSHNEPFGCYSPPSIHLGQQNYNSSNNSQTNSSRMSIQQPSNQCSQVSNNLSSLKNKPFMPPPNLQIPDLQLVCKYADHQSKPIISICFNIQCKDRLCCQHCLQKQLHQNCEILDKLDFHKRRENIIDSFEEISTKLKENANYCAQLLSNIGFKNTNWKELKEMTSSELCAQAKLLIKIEEWNKSSQNTVQERILENVRNIVNQLKPFISENSQNSLNQQIRSIPKADIKTPNNDDDASKAFIEDIVTTMKKQNSAYHLKRNEFNDEFSKQQFQNLEQADHEELISIIIHQKRTIKQLNDDLNRIKQNMSSEGMSTSGNEIIKQQQKLRIKVSNVYM